MSSSLIGRKLGKYQITGLVGQGGMATVYKGYQEDIDRYVAVKVLPPHPGLDQQFVDRFKLEARTIARLQHPHILPLYDYGVESDILYLVMAFVEGGSLHDRIKKGRLKLPRIAEMLRQVASALDYAHRQGIIHRDIKPDNILLDAEGNALLADFGIAKMVEGESNLTATGGLVGTPAYMSPEQGRGETLTSAADIYSLGVVVYEMVTGRQPYTANTPMQVVLKHINDPVPTLTAAQPDLPPALDVVISRALAKNPQQRYASAVEFAEDFARVAQGSGVSVPVQSASATPPPDATYTPPSGAYTPPPPGAFTPQSGVPTTTPTGPSVPQTIIVQQPGINTALLLGGFGVIAVLLVVLVVLLSSRPDQQPTAPPTQAAAAASPTAASAAARPTPLPTVGRLSFLTSSKLGDTITLQVQGLRPPPPGRVYAGWLKNTVTEESLLIGQVTLDPRGSGTLSFTDPAGRPLPTLYNAVAITDEDRVTATASGRIHYSGMVVPETMTALRHILISSPDGLPVRSAPAGYGAPPTQAADAAANPATGSLLDGALIEARAAAQHAGLAAGATNAAGMHLHAEHTINILNGTTEDYNGSGQGENPGRGVGVVRFLDLMQAELDAVANADGVSAQTVADLELIRVCVVNSRVRAARIIELEQALLAATDVSAVVGQASESTAVARALINGEDFNGNGQVEPFEAECGLEQIATFGVLVGSLPLFDVQGVR